MMRSSGPVLRDRPAVVAGRKNIGLLSGGSARRTRVAHECHAVGGKPERLHAAAAECDRASPGVAESRVATGMSSGRRATKIVGCVPFFRAGAGRDQRGPCSLEAIALVTMRALKHSTRCRLGTTMCRYRIWRRPKPRLTRWDRSSLRSRMFARDRQASGTLSKRSQAPVGAQQPLVRRSSRPIGRFGGHQRASTR